MATQTPFATLLSVLSDKLGEDWSGITYGRWWPFVFEVSWTAQDFFKKLQQNGWLAPDNVSLLIELTKDNGRVDLSNVVQTYAKTVLKGQASPAVLPAGYSPPPPRDLLLCLLRTLADGLGPGWCELGQSSNNATIFAMCSSSQKRSYDGYTLLMEMLKCGEITAEQPHLITQMLKGGACRFDLAEWWSSATRGQAYIDYLAKRKEEAEAMFRCQATDTDELVGAGGERCSGAACSNAAKVYIGQPGFGYSLCFRCRDAFHLQPNVVPPPSR